MDWEALRYAVYFNYAFPKNWLLNLGLQGQYAHEPLISGEQFGIGGVNSIRGFEERALSGDRGERVSMEIWAPPVSFIQNMRLLGFIDAGHIKVIKPAVGQINSETLISTGIGLRWRVTDQLNLQIDYGHEIREAKTPDVSGVKTHFSLFYRF